MAGPVIFIVACTDHTGEALAPNRGKQTVSKGLDELRFVK